MPINSHHPEYDKMHPKWKRCCDASDGQDAVHAAGTDYLPKLKDQTPDDYNAYVKRAGFYNATWRTISGLIGMVMRIPPVVEVPASVQPYLEDITLSGIPLNAFTQTILEEALEKGRVGILVDCPPVTSEEGTQPTLADAKAQNIRPTLQMYEAESIINWRTAVINNAVCLTLVVLEESEDVVKDEWTSTSEKRWRELSLLDGVYRQRMFKLEGGANGASKQIGEDIFPKMNNKTMDFIPFLFIGTDDLTPDIDEPPLIDLVDVNLAHYRVTADYEHGCHFTGLPTAVISGYTKESQGEKLYIGSANAWVFPDPNAKAEYLEFSGQGLDALVANLDRKEQQMAILGARMLEPQKKSAEAADSANIRRKGEESTLSAIAQTVGMGMQKVLTWLSDWSGAAGAIVTVELNRDFYPAPMSSQMLTAMLSGWQMGAPGFSDQELFDKFQKGDLISEGTTLEQEQARISNRALELQNTFNPPAAE